MKALIRFISWMTILAVIAVLLGVGLIFGSHHLVEKTSKNRLYTNVNQIPGNKAALVLGCCRILPNGRENRYFTYRVDKAAALYHAGKCKYFIVSGDNSIQNYDEPTEMQNALVKRGVPLNRIYRDFAGFRTLDSVVRAKEVFGQSELTIVSQPFHNKRAIYLARQNGIDAVGINCQDISSRGGLKTKTREYLARVKMVLDVYLLRTEPRFLGPKVELGGPRPKHGT